MYVRARRLSKIQIFFEPVKKSLCFKMGASRAFLTSYLDPSRSRGREISHFHISKPAVKSGCEISSFHKSTRIYRLKGLYKHELIKSKAKIDKRPMIEMQSVPCV